MDVLGVDTPPSVTHATDKPRIRIAGSQPAAGHGIRTIKIQEPKVSEPKKHTTNKKHFSNKMPKAPKPRELGSGIIREHGRQHLRLT
jgi:hypothetical protein